ncbi:MAG: hypothetical protein ACREDR_46480, partial [Blastocatellia bacterium]
MKLNSRLLLTALLGALLLGSACVRHVRVPELLPVQAQEVSVPELVDRINSYDRVKTISAQVLVDVTDYFTGQAETARKPPEGNGALRLQRPEKIRMLITAPIVNTNVADMASDGDEFAVALFYPSDKRAFVHGKKPNKIKRMDAEDLKEAKDPRVRAAGGLANIRPQHITDAFLIEPITDGAEYFREVDVETEPDTRPGRTGHFVKRTYYVIYILELEQNGIRYPSRKFWFDRTQPGTPLVRQQVFEDGTGIVASDIRYSDLFIPPDAPNITLPGVVTVSRPLD